MKTLRNYIMEANGVEVRELSLHAWNNEECVKMMENVIRSMNKKDPETISVEHLEKSSVMNKIIKTIIDTYSKNYGSFSIDTATRKSLKHEIAQKMVDSMEDYK